MLLHLPVKELCWCSFKSNTLHPSSVSHPQVQSEGGDSVSGLWAAESLLPALQHLPPATSPPPAALQTHPGEALQALSAHPRWLQGLQRYSIVCVCIFVYLSFFIIIIFLFLHHLSAALADVSEIVMQLQGTMMKMENFQKILELKKDLTGVDNLVNPGRVSVFIFIHCDGEVTVSLLQF